MSTVNSPTHEEVDATNQAIFHKLRKGLGVPNDKSKTPHTLERFKAAY